MPEEQATQVRVLIDCEISERGSLVTLFAHDADTDMCRLNHVHVVSTITDRQCYLVLASIPYVPHDVCLLRWR